MKASELKGGPIPVEKFGLYNAEALTDMLSNYDTDHGQKQTIPLDPSKLCAVQPEVYPDIVRGYLKHGIDELPELIAHKGKYYIVDGTHRIVSAIIKKTPKLQAIIYRRLRS